MKPRSDAGASLSGYVWALVACALTSGAAVMLRATLAEANLVLLYLVAVVLVTLRWGRGPGVAASLAAVLAFDLLLVQPYFSISVADSQYLLTFAIMLAVSLFVSHLTARLRVEAASARQREQRANVLFDLSRSLSAAQGAYELGAVAARELGALFHERVLLLVPDAMGVLRPVDDVAPVRIDGAAARLAALVFSRGQGAHGEPAPVTSAGIRYVPLRAPAGMRGVLLLLSSSAAGVLSLEQDRLLQTCAAQIALALERVHYATAARDATVAVESERLRNTLLSALSHDLRTPLTAITGLSAAIAHGDADSLDGARELAQAILQQATQMNNLVANLLHMARLQAGPVALDLQWQMLEEVVGSALAQMARALDGMAVQVDLAPTLPLLAFDAVLLERLLCNLLDNAAKYAGRGGAVRIGGEVRGDAVEVVVEDDGPGFGPGAPQRLFAKFTRGRSESNQIGAGLGLAICKAIVEAHGGTIAAQERDGGGARIVVTLPRGDAPPVLDEEAA